MTAPTENCQRHYAQSVGLLIQLYLLMRDGKTGEAETHLRRAVELNPGDAAARAGLGKCLVALDRIGEADEHLAEAVRLDEHGPAGEAAKAERSRIAHSTFRKPMADAERPDAVMYCLAAIERFETMPAQEVQKVGFEIAVLGMGGIDPNDAARRYTLKSRWSTVAIAATPVRSASAIRVASA